MKKILSGMLKAYGLVVFMTIPVLTSCAWVEPGTEDDPGKAVGVPTEPQAISNDYEVGFEYPEEQVTQ
jgi:hypothetical protein